MDVGSPTQGDAFTQGKGAVIVRARAFGKGYIDRHHQVRAELKGGGYRSAQGFFFLNGSQRPDVPGRLPALQLLQADGHRRHRGAVIQGVPA